MVKPTKIVALALVAVVVMALVAGVAYWSVGYDPTKVDPGLYVDGKRVDDPGTIITVDGHEVDFNVYRYVYMTSKATLSMYYGDETVFDHDPDGSLGEYVAEYADESVRQWFAWVDLGAELGVTADDELLAEVEAEIAEDKELYGAQFESNLASNYIADEETYRQVLTIQKLVAKAQDAYQEHLEAERGDEILEGIATAKHILITADGFAEREDEYEALMADSAGTEAPANDESAGGEEPVDEADEPADETDAEADGEEAAVDEEPADETDGDEEAADAGTDADATGDGDGDADGTADADDETDTDTEPADTDDTEKDEEYYDARAKAFADWLVEQIAASADPIAAFEEYRLAYDEDPGQQAEGYAGYTFAEGSMVTEFYEGALALEVDEISQPVQTSYGYHILLRLPLNEEAVEQDGLLASGVSALMNEVFTARFEEQDIEYGSYYASIKPANVV